MKNATNAADTARKTELEALVADVYHGAAAGDLRALRALTAMTGASQMVATGTGLAFRLPRNAGGVGLMAVALAPDDSWTVTAYTGRATRADGPTGRVVAERAGVPVSALRDVFEALTGLRVSLGSAAR